MFISSLPPDICQRSLNSKALYLCSQAALRSPLLAVLPFLSLNIDSSSMFSLLQMWIRYMWVPWEVFIKDTSNYCPCWWGPPDSSLLSFHSLPQLEPLFSRTSHTESLLLECGPYRAAEAHLLPSVQQAHKTAHILLTPQGVEGWLLHVCPLSSPGLSSPHPPFPIILLLCSKKAQISLSANHCIRTLPKGKWNARIIFSLRHPSSLQIILCEPHSLRL